MPPSQQPELNLSTEKYGQFGQNDAKADIAYISTDIIRNHHFILSMSAKIKDKELLTKEDFHKMNFTAALPEKPVFPIRPNQ